MRLYRLLLHLYPASFRAEYGGQMCAVFAQRRANGENPAALWAESMLDILANALRVHWDILRQDLRYTARTLARTPGFAVTAVLVAALGIGATTAAFSIADHVLLRPLPFADSDRLVKLWETEPEYSRMELSPANYRDWKRVGTAFESMAAYRGLSVDLSGQGEPERIDGAAVTAELFPMLGTRPVLGRLFTEEDDRESAGGTAILSYRLWQAVFGGDAGVLGRKVMLDQTPYVVIGVMPREFFFPSRDAEIWTPMRLGAAAYEERNDTYLHGVGKLRPGVTLEQALEQARAQAQVAAGQLARMYPKDNAHVGFTVIRVRDEVSPLTRRLLEALCGAAFCLLLIACTNLANLLLARSLARRKELAVRTAMGAGRDRLVRQMLTESLILAVLGGALGVALAAGAVPLLVRLVPQSLPIGEAPAMDLRVLGIAALLTMLTAVGFGVLPTVRACAKTDLSGLREGGREGVGGRRERLRSGLVIAEITASVVLLVSSGLLIRALWRLQTVDPGFRPDGVLTLRTSLPMPKYERTAPREQFYTHVLGEIRRMPGVSSAAYISFLPMVVRGGIRPVTLPGVPLDPSHPPVASLRFVTPGFFETMGIALRAGRDIRESDSIHAPDAAVVSESFVREFWRGENPLGRRFQIASRNPMVVGVAGDVRVRGLEQSSEPQVYLSYRQVGDGVSPWYAPKDLVIRSDAGAAGLMPAIRAIIRNADPDLPISDVRTMRDIVDGETAPRAVQVRVLAAFAGMALLLAGIGIHGLLSFAVSMRTQEIGVRVALGAQPRNVLGMVLRQGAALCAAGVVLGTALAYVAARALEALLAGIKPADSATFAAVASLAFVMMLAGTVVPALRALRVNPISAIRME
jgi:predicted permease